MYRACLTVDVTETGLAVRTAALGQHTGRAFALVVLTFLLRTRRAGIGEGGTFLSIKTGPRCEHTHETGRC